MKCPVCGKNENTILVCGACWWTVPVNDRRQFSHMHRHKQDTTTKAAKIIRNLKAVRQEESVV
jgi:hypothetical protein